MAQSNWNPNMQTQNSYRNQGSQSREAPVQNVSWNRGTQEMPWDEREKNRGTQWRGNVNSRSRNEGIQEQHIAEHWIMQGKGQEQKDTRNSGIRETAMQDVRFPKSEEKKSLWRRLVEWAFPNFKINKKNILLIHPDMSGIKTSQNRKRFRNRMIPGTPYLFRG